MCKSRLYRYNKNASRSAAQLSSSGMVSASKSAGVDEGEHHAVFEVSGCLKDGFYFFFAEYVGQFVFAAWALDQVGVQFLLLDLFEVAL